MALLHETRNSLERSFRLYRDFVAALPPDALSRKLPGLRSNSIGAQLWCVVGARESYGRALEAGRWSGFSCSLEDANDGAQVVEALARSEEAVRAALEGAGAFDDPRNRLLLDLVEHEAAHQGQLIRYLYGLDLPIPASWRERYALEP
ncbi:MAG TPA: hypothetical protein VNN10_14715 [Dehalococcoidia bacterium]|nr:hypothetical protein [Dehalococcoidia bacterium]